MEVFIWGIPSNAARPSVRRKAREETLNLQITGLFSKTSSGMLKKALKSILNSGDSILISLPGSEIDRTDPN
jgi:hypothetical protein